MAKSLYFLDQNDLNNLRETIRLTRSQRLPQPQGLLPIGRNTFLARITSTGPNAEADFTDARYWLREVCITNSDNDYTSALTFAYPPAGEGRWLAALNIVESVAGTHNLAIDDTVLVVCYASQDKASLARYYFNESTVTSNIRPGKITAVTTVEGPPSNHTYAGIYIDAAAGTWTGLPCLMRKDNNVVFLPMEVDDYVAVVSELVAGVWTVRGVLGGESPDFMVDA